MSETKSTELQPAVHGLEFPVKYAQRDCGHFCEACARRDDQIAVLREALAAVQARLVEGGISPRAYFAGKAMQGDWAAQSRDVGEFVDAVSSEALTVRARLYLRAADALIAELSK